MLKEPKPKWNQETTKGKREEEVSRSETEWSQGCNNGEGTQPGRRNEEPNWEKQDEKRDQMKPRKLKIGRNEKLSKQEEKRETSVSRRKE